MSEAHEPKRRSYPRIALALCGLGLALGVHAQMSGGGSTIAAEMPVTLKAGEIRTVPFQVRTSAGYEIALQAERRLPPQQLSCLMGIELARQDRCAGAPSPVDMSWKISLNGTTLAEGLSAEFPKGSGWTQGTVEKVIGATSLTEAPGYVLEVRSLKDASVLAPTNPKVVLKISALEAGYSAGLGGGELLAAFACIIAGLAGISFWAWRRRRALNPDKAG